MRHNPFSNEDFLAFLRGKGLDRMAYLVGKYPDIVEPFLGKIHNRLIEKGLLTGAAAGIAYTRKSIGKHSQGSGGEYESPRAGHDREHASGPLTDYEGWTQLAALVDSALGDQPAALREALKRAFHEEAAKAA